MSEQGISEEFFRAAFVDKLPDVFARVKVPQLLNGIISVNHLRNLEQTTGKPKSFVLGNKAFYHKKDFLEWAREHYHVRPSDDCCGVQED